MQARFGKRKKRQLMQQGILFFCCFFFSLAHAAEITCPQYYVEMEGETSMPGIVSYHEKVVLEKYDRREGYDGQWMLKTQDIVITYPGPIPYGVSSYDVHDLGYGMSMACQSTILGNQIMVNCTGENVHIEVENNVVGSKLTGFVVGQIDGDEFSLQWDPNNPMSPVDKGPIIRPQAKDTTITLDVRPSRERYVFSEDSLGELVMELEAEVSPKAYEDKVQWELPNLEGSERLTEPESSVGAKLKATYKGLPVSNNDFGKKRIKARIQVDACRVEDEKEVSFFFPRDARNHPGNRNKPSDQMTPNWFYYWHQTSAKVAVEPKFDDQGRIAPVANNQGCQGRWSGYYENVYFDTTFHICDLKKKLGEKFKSDQSWRRDGNDLKRYTTTGIDTYATISRHEYCHVKNFRQWWYPYRYTLISQTNPSATDIDGNGIEDAEQNSRDSDLDYVPDTVEDMNSAAGMDKHNACSLFPGGNCGGMGQLEKTNDEEIMCIVEEADNWTAGSADKEDWAVPGKQWPGP